ncbi:Glutathione transport system permease protein GsiC [Acaryochloris thomasi RCC1774]|uniref:Glutathione transport system permease protein GsiC n=1 Tax=Acaryochloris thomasi RCC1774 TaxID=1764569 RepID=A0A2W1JBS0_9CYAN|nr:ABC transporter permease [Acaryochloris thomasi]PZD71500.1 Glutathione transport system permease protein GsiC [Acaryochloris thomasi RCC1774]
MIDQPKTPDIQSKPSVIDGLRAFLTSDTFAYVVKRLFQGLITLFLASILCYVIVQLTPGNYLDKLRTDPKISPERLAELAKQFGLEDEPESPIAAKAWSQFWSLWGPWLGWVFQRYWLWLGQVLQGNFGYSFASQRPVLTLIAEKVPNTLLLSIASILITWAIALPLGIIGAVKQNRLTDRVLRVFSYAGQGFPSFITALLLLFFAQSTPLFPVGNMTSVYHADLSPIGKVLDIGWHMILPTLALTVTSFAGLQRLTRGNLLDVLRQNYVQTARAKGLPENKVIYVHALRNAVNPLITLLGFEFASLLGGAFIAETFFNWPGLGRLILKAVLEQDLYLVMASLMIGAVMLIIGNLLADLLLKVVDPRIQLDEMK